MSAHSVEQHFEGRAPVVRAIYDAVIRTAKKLGPVVEDPKKTSIHLNHRTAFAGVATRKEAIVLTIKAPSDIKSTRVHKREQVSANRWHVEVKLDDPKQVDAELAAWLKQAFEISG
jgi:hypothetical protein